MAEQQTDQQNDVKPATPGRVSAPGNRNGVEKAALWLLSVDEDFAIEVLSHLPPKEVRLLADAVRSIGGTSPDELKVIHLEFGTRLEADLLHLNGSMEYLGQLASKAFGDGKGARYLGLTAEEEDDILGLDGADIEVLSSVVRQEHPQVIAAVLAQLGSGRAAEVLTRFPDPLKREVIYRLASLKRVPTAAMEQAERVLSAGLPAGGRSDSKINGVKLAANLLNQLDTDTATDLLDSISSDTDPVATNIRQAMFTFEDLNGLDRRGFQTLLKEVQSDQLLVALKTASSELQEKIFDSLSKRAAEMLREDLEVMGPVRLQDVQEAQTAVVTTALQLRDDGRLAIAGQGSDELV